LNDTTNHQHGLSEGDSNLSNHRRQWQQRHIDDRTRHWLDRDARCFLHQSLSTPCLNVLVESRGASLTDLQGRSILDFHGNSAHQVGYAHPRVMAAVKQQLDTLPFCPRRYTNAAAIRLAERLVEITPDPLGKVLLAPGGTGAVGMALKLARVATGRFKTISMWDSFTEHPWTPFPWAANRSSGRAWDHCCRDAGMSRRPIPTAACGIPAAAAAAAI
jgi:4-aminobutyrate aminotransferase